MARKVPAGRMRVTCFTGPFTGGRLPARCHGQDGGFRVALHWRQIDDFLHSEPDSWVSCKTFSRIYILRTAKLSEGERGTGHNTPEDLPLFFSAAAGGERVTILFANYLIPETWVYT